MKTIFTDAEVILQFINAMEAEQQNSNHAKLEIQDEHMHAVVLKSLLESGEYKTRRRKWSKLPDDQQTRTAWKTTSSEVYMEKRQAEAAREGEDKPFGGAAADKAHDQLHQQAITSSDVTAPLSNQMMDLIEGYLNNISAATTQAVANGGPLAEFSTILAVSVDTVEAQAK